MFLNCGYSIGLSPKKPKLTNENSLGDSEPVNISESGKGRVEMYSQSLLPVLTSDMFSVWGMGQQPQSLNLKTEGKKWHLLIKKLYAFVIGRSLSGLTKTTIPHRKRKCLSILPQVPYVPNWSSLEEFPGNLKENSVESFIKP